MHMCGAAQAYFGTKRRPVPILSPQGFPTMASRQSQDRASARVSSMTGRLDAYEVSSRHAAEAHRSTDGSFRTSSRSISQKGVHRGAGGPPSARTDENRHDEESQSKEGRVVTLCNGMAVMPPSVERKASSRKDVCGFYGVATEPMPIDRLRRQMDEMESGATSSRSTTRMQSRSNSMSGKAKALKDTKASASAVEGPPVTFQTPTFAQALEAQYMSGLENIDGGMTTEQRLTRKRQQEELKAERMKTRAKRQGEADEARVLFGMTTKEKKERKDRAMKLEQQQFEATQATAGRDFVKRSRMIFVANWIALSSQLLFIFDVRNRCSQTLCPLEFTRIAVCRPANPLRRAPVPLQTRMTI